jgi:hypothetical protein
MARPADGKPRNIAIEGVCPETLRGGAPRQSKTAVVAAAERNR